MDLQEFNEGTPATKLWLNPVVNNVSANLVDTVELKTKGNPSSGVYNPSLTPLTGFASISAPSGAMFIRLQDIVHVQGVFAGAIDGSSPINLVFRVALPPGSAVADVNLVAPIVNCANDNPAMAGVMVLSTVIDDATHLIITCCSTTGGGIFPPLGALPFTWSIMFSSSV